MSHPTHRDRKQIVEFKHAPAVLDDDYQARIEALLAADQQQERERTPYKEAPKGEE